MFCRDMVWIYLEWVFSEENGCAFDFRYKKKKSEREKNQTAEDSHSSDFIYFVSCNEFKNSFFSPSPLTSSVVPSYHLLLAAFRVTVPVTWVPRSLVLVLSCRTVFTNAVVQVSLEHGA